MINLELMIIIMLILLLLIFVGPYINNIPRKVVEKTFGWLLNDNLIADDDGEKFMCEMVGSAIVSYATTYFVSYKLGISSLTAFLCVVILLIPMLRRLIGKARFKDSYLYDYYEMMNLLCNLVFGGSDMTEAIREVREVLSPNNLSYKRLCRGIDKADEAGLIDVDFMRAVMAEMNCKLNIRKISEINNLLNEEFDLRGEANAFMSKIAPELHRRCFVYKDRVINSYIASFKYSMLVFIIVPLGFLFYLLYSTIA